MKIADHTATRLILLDGVDKQYAIAENAAEAACKAIGMEIAPESFLQAAQSLEYDVCSAGWARRTSGSLECMYPLVRPRPQCGDKAGLIMGGCGGMAGVWCFGAAQQYGAEPPGLTKRAEFRFSKYVLLSSGFSHVLIFDRTNVVP